LVQFHSLTARDSFQIIDELPFILGDVIDKVILTIEENECPATMRGYSVSSDILDI
jgi:hypothetical protein